MRMVSRYYRIHGGVLPRSVVSAGRRWRLVEEQVTGNPVHLLSARYRSGTLKAALEP